MPTAKTILTRIVYGAVMIAVLAGVLLVEYLRPWPQVADIDGAPLACVLIVLCIMGLREFKKMATAAGAGLLGVSAMLGTLAIATLPIWPKFIPVDFVLFNDFRPLAFVPMMNVQDVLCMIGIIVAAIFLEQMIRYRLDAALGRIAATVLAVAYLGVGSALVLAIRDDFRMGVPGLILFLAAVKGTDIGAYFTGSAIGKHKLIPWLSPGKSWEGLFGGLATAAGTSMLVVWAFGMDLSLGAAAAFGAIIGAIGQFADLCESLLKRSADMKDSGALVPSFGGVLDIIDSPLLAAPVAFWLLRLML